MSAAPSTSSSSSPAPPEGATSPKWCFVSPRSALVEDRDEAELACFAAGGAQEQGKGAELGMLDRIGAVAGRSGRPRSSLEYGGEGMRPAASRRPRPFCRH